MIFHTRHMYHKLYDAKAGSCNVLSQEVGKENWGQGNNHMLSYGTLM